MKRHRLSDEQAEAIVRCWLANGRADNCGMNAENFGKFIPSISVRVWLRGMCKAASDYLWDDQPNKAYAFLLKHGLQSERGPEGLGSSMAYDAKKYRAAQYTMSAVRRMKHESSVGPANKVRRRVK